MRRLTAAITLALMALAATTASAASPTIMEVGISAPTSTSVTLDAEINSQDKGTQYHFEYGLADCSANPCASTPVGKLTAGTSPVAVHAPLEGLASGTTYHFQVVAVNGKTPADTVESPDQTFATYLESQKFPACGNDGLRIDNPAGARIARSSANLPDCRAYEQASPVDKVGGDVTGTVPFVRSALQGGGITFLSSSGVPGGKGSQELPAYLATRGNGTWSTQGLLPPGESGQQALVLGWTPDFSQVYTQASLLGEPPAITFMESSSEPPVKIVDYTKGFRPFLAGASSTGTEVLFESKSALLSGALEGKWNVYLWDRASDQLSLVSMLNGGGSPAKGSIAGSYDWLRGTNPITLSEGGAFRDYYTQEQHAISVNGSAAYFTAAGTGQLYLRENPTQKQSALDINGECLEPALACTIEVSASHRTTPDPAGSRPAAFMGASANGSVSYFTSSEKLTNDANTGPEQEPAGVAKADLAGTNISPVFLPTHASEMAVDSGHIYWVNIEKGTIARANLDGQDVENEFITATDNPKDVEVVGEFIYWTNAAKEEGEGTIGRAKLGPGGAEEVNQSFVGNAGNPHGVAVDAQHVYWTNSAVVGSVTGFIGRAKIDGNEAQPELLEIFSSLGDLSSIVADGSHIYWSDTNNSDISRISRANLDGSSYEITFIFLGQNVGAKGLALDAGHIYWSTQANSLIGRAKLDGNEAASELEPDFIKDAGHPQGLAVDPTHIYWTANGEAPPNPGNDLYRYDADAEEESLSDIAPDTPSENGTEVQGVLGTSEDGSYVYFAANGVPDAVTNSPNGQGESAAPGDCEGIIENATGECNLYLWREGVVSFIARLDVGGLSLESDAANWAATPTGISPSPGFQKTARVTPTGQTLLFRSQRELTDYDNQGTPQLYRYEAGQASARCVSCNPTGLAPTGGARLGNISPSVIIPKRPASYLTHNLSANGGRVFFETTNEMVEEDTNGEKGCPAVGSALQKFPACTDVYEWEEAGEGSCDASHAVAQGGCLYLISTGKGTEPALIADASGDGGDVFFFTRSRLVGQDEDQLVDVYDARVEGGLSAQNQPPLNPCESIDGCHLGEPSPPRIESPPKFTGPGNPPKKTTCAKGKHKVKGRCVAKHGKAKKHHKQGKGKAKSNRRAGR